MNNEDSIGCLVILIIVVITTIFCIWQCRREDNEKEACKREHNYKAYKTEAIRTTTSDGCVIKSITECDAECTCSYPIYYTTCPKDLKWTQPNGKYSRDVFNLHGDK